jgi:hypothetical protein
MQMAAEVCELGVLCLSGIAGETVHAAGEVAIAMNTAQYPSQLVSGVLIACI